MTRFFTIFGFALLVVIPVVRYPAPLCGGKTAYFFPVGDHYEVSCEHGPTYF